MSAEAAKKQTATTDYTTQGRGKLYDNIADTVGDTPMVKLHKVTADAGAKAEVYAKLEFFNPLSSVKDRLALGMINEAEKEGKLKPDTVLVEATSGNTGIALAFIAAARGYKLILTMPESMSLERRNMLKILGAQLELTEAAKGMKGAIAKAQEIVASNPKALLMQQFENPANPKIHSDTTANEVWNDTKGEVDIFITGVGTGGTLTGVAQVLKAKKSSIKIIAVEPEDSAVLSGGQPGPHKIQGLGAGFIPAVLDTKLIDEVITIGNETSFKMTRAVNQLEGIPVGISSGATIAAALEVAARPENAGKKIVVICASGSERYISTALFDF